MPQHVTGWMEGIESAAGDGVKSHAAACIYSPHAATACDESSEMRYEWRACLRACHLRACLDATRVERHESAWLPATSSGVPRNMEGVHKDGGRVGRRAPTRASRQTSS
jgi:hypothetical protein